MRDFRKLEIWNLGIILSSKIYYLASSFPKSEKFGLTSQCRRASVSVSANIAEGAGRNTDKDFARFISINIGSLCELETLFEISLKLGYITKEQYNEVQESINKLRRKCVNFNKHLKNRTALRKPHAL